MNAQKLTKEIILTLKALMKKKGLKYSELAKHLNLSVPAIKRIMTAEEIPFSRVIGVCEFLGLQLEDVLQIQNANVSGLFYFNQEQEEFFAKNPSFLAYFFELYNGKKSPAEIEKKHKITKSSTDKYLKKLTQLGLVSLDSNQKLKIHASGVISWSDHGPLGNTFSRQMIISFSKWATDKITEPGKMLVELHGWSLTEENYRDFKKEYKDLTIKYRQISSYNRKILEKDSFSNISVMTIADDWDEKMFHDVHEIGI